MVRSLKYHERTLLKKADFLQWKSDDNVREVKILRRYHIQKREDYHKYNRLCGAVTKVRALALAAPAAAPLAGPPTRRPIPCTPLGRRSSRA